MDRKIIKTLSYNLISFFFEKFTWGWLTTVGVILSVLGNVVMLRGKNALVKR